MKIGIAGYGFVGKAHECVLSSMEEIIISDPYKNINGNLNDADCIIICVSTPQSDDGSCNVDNVCDVIGNAPNVPILIKSTISLEGWRFISRSFPDKQLAFSPEFLTAENANKDLQHTTQIYLGGESTKFWIDRYVYWWPEASITIAHPEELILTKYFRNAYLATKVSFFNQVYDLCEAVGADFNIVRQSIGNDPRIGHSHTNVTNNRGFGGHCFPKDVNALIRTAERDNVDLSILAEALSYNNKIRR